MLWIKAFHIIGMVAWFAGLFYLPRLFVYHSESKDTISLARFKVMEWRLYYGITWPAAILTTIFGVWLLSYSWPYYMHAAWFHAKLMGVIFLWSFHLGCGHYLKQFKQDNNSKSTTFYRVFNEIPTLLLIAIVILVVVKPTYSIGVYTHSDWIPYQVRDSIAKVYHTSSIISKSSLDAPQSGQNQFSGTSSHKVPASIPSSGHPWASS